MPFYKVYNEEHRVGLIIEADNVYYALLTVFKVIDKTNTSPFNEDIHIVSIGKSEFDKIK